MTPDFSTSGQLPPSGKGATQFVDAFHLLRRRSRFIILATGLVTLVIWLIASSLPERYGATADLVFVRADAQVLDYAPDIQSQETDTSAVETEMDVLKTRLFLGMVVDALGLLSEPTFNPYLDPDAGDPVQMLRSHLIVLRGRLAEWSAPLWSLLGDSADPSVEADSSQDDLDATPAAATAPAGTDPDVAESEPPAVADDVEPAEPENLVPGVPLGLQRDRAIERLRSAVSFSRDEASLAVTIRVNHTDPELAASIANMIGRTYMEWSLELKRLAAQQTLDFFEVRAEKARARVSELESAILAFANENNLSSGTGNDTLNLRFAEVNGELARARIELLEATGRLERLKAGDTSGQAETLLSAPLFDTLRDRISSLEENLADVSVTLGPQHPDRLRIAASLESARNRLDFETQRLIEAQEELVAMGEMRISQLFDELDRLKSDRRDVALAEIRLREMETELNFERRRSDKVLEGLDNLNRLGDLLQPSARILSEAAVPTKPYLPNIGTMAVGAAVATGAMATILALVLEGLDNRIRSAGQIQEVLSVQTIVHISKRSRQWFGRNRPRKLAGRSPSGPYEESLRALWRSIASGARANKNLVVMLTASLPDVEKNAVSCGLAATAAQQGRRTALVGFENGKVADVLGELSPGRPLTDVFDRGAAIENVALKAKANPAVDVFLAAGQSRIVPRALTDNEIESFLRALRSVYDVIIVDAAAILVTDEASSISQHCDTNILFVHWGKTRLNLLGDVAWQTQNDGMHIDVVALGQIDERRHAAGRYGGRSQYRQLGEKPPPKLKVA